MFQIKNNDWGLWGQLVFQTAVSKIFCLLLHRKLRYVEPDFGVLWIFCLLSGWTRQCSLIEHIRCHWNDSEIQWATANFNNQRNPVSLSYWNWTFKPASWRSFVNLSTFVAECRGVHRKKQMVIAKYMASSDTADCTVDSTTNETLRTNQPAPHPPNSAKRSGTDRIWHGENIISS